MKLLLSFTFISLFSLIYSQEFSFKIYFEDAIGNIDSLEVGYDDMASDSIDGTFGEINIISTPLNDTFDVRISDAWKYNMLSLQASATFHTKKQIIQKNCPGYSSLINVDIHCLNWPVTAYVNQYLADSCNNGSFLTSFNPGGWFDVGSPSDLGIMWLGSGSSAEFSSNIQGAPHYYYSYINNNNDSIPVFWITFVDQQTIISNVNEYDITEEVSIFPNPASDNIEIGLSNSDIELIRIFNSQGKLIKSSKENIINISSCINGLYLIEINLKNNERVFQKIIKK